MTCINLWNDSSGGGSATTSNNVLLALEWPVFYLRDFCDYLPVKWLVFIRGMTRPAGVTTSNNVSLAVRWPVFYLRNFVQLFGREMAFIYLWNDSSGGGLATTSNVFFGHEMACILFVRLFGREMVRIYLWDYLAVK